MNNFKVFDIESTNWNMIYAIGIYDGVNEPIKRAFDIISNKERIKNNNEFILWLFDNLSDGDVVYAHNGGRFDFLFIMDFIGSGHAKLTDMIFLNGSAVMIEVLYNYKKITFKDSFNILPHSLAMLTKDFDTPHKKLKMDYAVGLDNDNFNDYFNNDLMGLHEVITASGLSEYLTVASNAIHRFNKRFYNGKMSRNSDRMDDIFRNAYYGGRVEVFKRHGVALNYYDVNSLYPFVMLNNVYPLPIRDNYLSDRDFHNLGIYHAEVSIKDIHIPVLPIRKDGKLIYPTGSFEGYWCSPELELAERMGYRIKVLSGYSFLESDYIFKDYVNHYYEIKKTHEGAQRSVAKLMLNSLYGKFGQKRDRDSLRPATDGDDMALVIGNLSFVKEKQHDQYSNYMHSEIAAMVTSYARAYLYSLMQKCEGDVYYCDTDSIITSKTLTTDNELGGLKREHEIDEYIGLLPKLYAIKDTNQKVVIRAKGYRVEQLNFNHFIRALNGDYEGIKTSFNRMLTFASGYKTGSGSFTETGDLKRNYRNSEYKRVFDDNDSTPISL